MRACTACLCAVVAVVTACSGRDDSAATLVSPYLSDMHADVRPVTIDESGPAGVPAAGADPDPCSRERSPDAALDLGRFAPTDEDAATPFAACSADAECVAVPKVGCCHIGWKAAVRKDEADAYEASFRCTIARPICIEMLVLDRRKPQCNVATRLCELVDP